MDKTNRWNTAAPPPSTDDENDALAKRVSEKWGYSVPGRGRVNDQVVQKLRDGRVRVIAVESTRSRRRPVSL